MAPPCYQVAKKLGCRLLKKISEARRESSLRAKGMAQSILLSLFALCPLRFASWYVGARRLSATKHMSFFSSLLGNVDVDGVLIHIVAARDQTHDAADVAAANS